jgi:anoctamin-10
MLEREHGGNYPTLSAKALKSWFVPTNAIREYYGDEVAVYYEWMNFFLLWVAIPGGLGIIIKTLNFFFYEDTGKSPLNAAFSIMMAIWATMFATEWKRH